MAPAVHTNNSNTLDTRISSKQYLNSTADEYDWGLVPGLARQRLPDAFHQEPPAIQPSCLASQTFFCACGDNIPFGSPFASCGGFNGISDSFTAALWGLNYVAYGALEFLRCHLCLLSARSLTHPSSPALHIPADQPILLCARHGEDWIYENGTPKRVAIINYLDDPTGETGEGWRQRRERGDQHWRRDDARAAQVKRLDAESVTQKGNIKWANQNLRRQLRVRRVADGHQSDRDGRLRGRQTCTIKVKAPGMALVFLTEDAGRGDAERDVCDHCQDPAGQVSHIRVR
ncbi:hypothetical protein C8R43DRAFT_1127285 [Mycena crocata]|nr:hypothetical protein C8R43DRAFT_1127285 [Mycena crocata]